MREKHRDINGIVHPLGIENGCSACWNNTFASSGVFFRYSYQGTFQKWDNILILISRWKTEAPRGEMTLCPLFCPPPQNSHIINHGEKGIKLQILTFWECLLPVPCRRADVENVSSQRRGVNVQVVLTLALLKGPLQGAHGRIPLVHSWRKRWSSCGAFQTATTRELHMTTSKGLSQFPDHEKIQVVYTSGDIIMWERITEPDTKQRAHNRRMSTRCTGISLPAWKTQQHLSSLVVQDALQSPGSNPCYPQQRNR